MPSLPSLAAPDRLPTGGDLAPRPLASGRGRPSPRSQVVTVDLHAPPLAFLGAEAGVATFQAETGADFVWTPLQGATPIANGGLRIQSAALATGDLMVTLATHRRYARHGYIVRLRVPAATLTAKSEPVQLTVVAEMVELLLPTGSEQAGPLQLRRTEDPQWLPMQQASTGLVLTTGVQTKVLLGAGTYELASPLAGAKAQSFVVPGSEAVIVRKDLAQARAGRP